MPLNAHTHTHTWALSFAQSVFSFAADAIFFSHSSLLLLRTIKKKDTFYVTNQLSCKGICTLKSDYLEHYFVTRTIRSICVRLCEKANEKKKREKKAATLKCSAV